MTEQTIDLGGLPAPDMIEALDYEQIVTQLKQLLLARNADYAEMLSYESDPLVIAIEAFAYRELLLRQRINEAVRSNLLAFATGADLDQLGAFYGVVRQTGEGDEILRVRIKDRILGSSTAGGEAHYRYQAFSVSTDIRDIAVDSPEPGLVRVSVLANTGVDIGPLVEKVKTRVAAPDVRVLTDTVEVVPTELVAVDIVADILPLEGSLPIDRDILSQSFTDRLELQRRLGWDLAPSWIISQLHSDNVKEVLLQQPSNNVVIQPNQCVVANSITLNIITNNI
ncbi:MAG: phage-related baseplate assembly protein [Phenylobacterium sp.]|jgi:phage-related baseplate assembly protein